MVYLIIDGVGITSLEQLEQIIADLPEESQIGLRLIFNEAVAKN